MDAASIEETNRVRAALGLNPLPVPGAPSDTAGLVFKDKGGDPDEEPASTIETRSAEGFNNWKKLEEERKTQAQRDARKEAIRKAREQAERFKKLEGKGLGDADDGGDVDTKTWLMQQKKRQKKIDKARKLQYEQEEKEAQEARERQYTAADITGLKVGHELGNLDDGDEHIFTLADQEIGGDDDDEGEDELEAMDIREKEKLEERLESKKRKRAYDPNASDGTQALLSQYDEKEKRTFTLGANGFAKEEQHTNDDGVVTNTTRVKISLDLLKDDAPISDYVDPSEIKVRKPKKKKTKSSKRKALDDDDIFPVVQTGGLENGANMDLDDEAAAPVTKSKKSTFDENFVDDDDLQANLANQRRAALKKRKKTRPEDLVKQLRDETPASPDAMETAERPEDEYGLVIDETSEFVANLRKEDIDARQRREAQQKETKPKPSSSDPGPAEIDEEGDVDMAQSYAEIEAAEGNNTISQEITTTGLEEEATLNRGIGATLAMLQQRGLVKANTGDESAKWRERQRFIAEKHKAEEEADRRAKLQRERDRQSGRLDHMSTKDREEYARHSNTQRDQLESRKMAEMFNKEYKPNIELKYVDEFGRRMNEKEAFKELSHQFHGKGSGKQKTEKKLKKIADEKRREAMSSLDSSHHTGMGNAQDVQAKKNRAAGVRLQ